MILLSTLLFALNVASANESGSKGEAAPEDNMSNRDVDIDKIHYKPGKGLVVASRDGDFKMITRLRAQLLYTLNAEDEWSHGLQLRRARLLFQGNVSGKHNRYKFELAVSPKDIGLRSTGTISKSPLLDWYFHLSHYRDFTVRMGQYKVPYSRQRVVSSGNLQLVDRSIANAEFTVDRDIGLDIRSKNLFGLDRLRYYAG
ncbi:MAG: porin, partial [Myxococcota bacterium]|nr:porin [Myxococcota bacterium]